MHCHQSLWKGEKPLFAGDGYAGLSEIALITSVVLLKHAAAIVAFAAPTTNSYKRLAKSALVRVKAYTGVYREKEHCSATSLTRRRLRCTPHRHSRNELWTPAFVGH
jgi:hypothetical protein